VELGGLCTCLVPFATQTEVPSALMTHQQGSLQVGGLDLALKWRLHPRNVAFSTAISEKRQAIRIATSRFWTGGWYFCVHAARWGWKLCHCTLYKAIISTAQCNNSDGVLTQILTPWITDLQMPFELIPSNMQSPDGQAMPYSWREADLYNWPQPGKK
jgi:hypothetical protein